MARPRPPATTASIGTPTNGTRLRIKEAWWKANADQVLGTDTQARVVGEALRRYGCILADGSGGTSIQLNGVADKRLEPKLHARLKAIPVSALEFVDTPPTLQIKGPTTLELARPGRGR